MINYDYECQQCYGINQVIRPLSQFSENIVHHCTFCHESSPHKLVIVKAPATEDWGNGGSGRFFEDLSATGMSFTSKSSYNKYLKENGIREWTPKPGMPSNGKG